MRIVIIEDEPLMAEDLRETLAKISENIQVDKTLTSVTEAVSYLANNTAPDLIFSDIQLGDGKSFEIFNKAKINIPVIFCTAYDAFALEAFKNNGIDYVLKPFTKRTIKNAIDKYNLLLAGNNNYFDYRSILNDMEAISSGSSKQSYLLINERDKIIPIKISDVLLFDIEYKMVQMVTILNQRYRVNYTLDELEQICGQAFYRVNRKFLINRNAVKEIRQHYARKLLVKLKAENDPEVLVSKGKVTEFLNWLRK
ncbi:MAG: response regulator transcription factor [Chitinophagaceae bacterium]|nr:response regulator transcription factor [Chitinophagaceae bacterium]MCB9054549.1 response regulator transcription factor [Chitinophagales bacterium]